jgi:hypothetical protein
MLHKLFYDYWNPYLTVGLAGLFSALYFGITGSVWAVTGEFTRYGGHLLQLLHVDVSNWAYFNLIKFSGSPLERTDGWIVIGMLAGPLVTVLLGNHFKLRVPQQKRRLLQGFAGGIIAGFGARLALGCNLAAFFTGLPQFSFHAWIFMLATAAGTFIGVKIIGTSWWRGKPNLQPFAKSGEPARPTGHPYQRFLGSLIGLCFLGVVVYLLAVGKTMLAAAALFGAAFGILIERGQICFTSAFRDLWISGRSVMTKSLAIGMTVGTIGTFFLIETGMPAVIKVAAPSTLIGGLLFGIGIVLAGGCETGWMYRAVEGQVHFWAVGAGNIIGATLLAFAWDHLGVYDALVSGWKPVNLIEAWGAPLALGGTLALLLVWYLFSVYWEKHYRFASGSHAAGQPYVSGALPIVPKEQG